MNRYDRYVVLWYCRRTDEEDTNKALVKTYDGFWYLEEYGGKTIYREQVSELDVKTIMLLNPRYCTPDGRRYLTR